MWETSQSCQVMTCLLLIALPAVHPVRQDLSVAGLRKGLEGERSGLFMEQVRIVKEMRARTHGQKPRYMVWENVCFDADTLVTCDTGYKRIEDVAVGNLVKTMSGRYMPVMKVFRTGNQKVIRLKVSGAEDLIVTPNHPFLAREKTYPKGKNREIGEPKWVRADELTSGHMIAYKADTPSLPDVFISKCEAFALGRWLADGSVDIKKSTPRIFISCGLLKADETEAELRKLPWDIHKNQVHKTAVNFCFTSAEFYGLIKDAGRGAGNKSVPSFVFNLPIFLQKEVLRGYTSGDGYIRQRGNNTEYSASTASRKLAYGIARLIRNVYRVAANISVREPKDGLIGCRVLHANYPSYNITASLSNKVTTGYDDGEFIWQCVKSIEPEEEKRTVFNLSVYGDNTYGANDVVVHNCGAFSSNGGKDFQAVLTEICRIAEPDAPDVPLPEKGKWPKAGCLYDELANWSVAWRTHDSQWWGVPQRRKRISVLADFSGLTAPEIMFDPQYRRAAEDGKPIETFSDTGAGAGQQVQPLSQSLPGDPESCSEERKETAGSVRDGVAATITATYGTKWNGNAGAYSGENFVYGERSAISFQEQAGKPGGGKGILIQDEHVGALSTLNNQSVFCIEGHVVDRDTAQNGFGIKENIAQTLNATDRHAVFYEGYQHQAYREAEKSGPLTAENSNHVRGDTPLVQQPIMVEMTSTKNTIIEDGIRTTLTARMGTGGNQVNAVCVGNGQLNQMSMAEQANTLDTMHDQQAILCFQNTDQGWWNQSDVGATLRTPCGGDSTKANLVLSSEDGDIAETLDASYFKGHGTRNGKERTFVYVDNGRTNQATAVDCRNSTEGPVSGTLQNTSFKNLNSNSVCRQDNVVRRLTPLECERLQGYPDGWTDIGEWTDSKGKKHKASDAPRYKALGNSIALPYWAWLLKRISAQYERPATLGSLFSGISGFDLCWTRCNGIGSVLWESEVEGFCIAVSTQHFGDEDRGIEGDVAKYL